MFGVTKTPEHAGGVRIACVGDSHTAGHGSSNASAAYPGALQQILGSAFDVTNLGAAGTTALSPGRFRSGALQGNPGGNPLAASFWSSSQFGVFNSSTWDLVLIMVSAHPSLCARF